MTNAPSFKLFHGKSRVDAHAVLVGQRLNIKSLRQVPRLAESPLVIEVGEHGCAVLFRYGVAVLFGVKGLEQANFLSTLNEYVVEPHTKVETENTAIIVSPEEDEAILHDGIRIRVLDMERIQIIADVLAKSIALSFYEAQIADTFDRIEPVSADMQARGYPGGKRARDLLKHIGTTLSIQRRMVGQVEVDDKPDLLWDKPYELERFYARLEDEYEIKERHVALKEKLELIYRTAETMLGLLQDRRTLNVEWYIVILIVFDIVLSLGEKLYLHITQ